MFTRRTSLRGSRTPVPMPKRDLRLLAEEKRDGNELSAAEWSYVVEQSLASTGDPAQISALLMACVFVGMSVAETAALTQAMVQSGEELKFTCFSNAVDKHSSGGVGDTASLILVPLLAACGENVAKLSGRALGHTGGTLDKLSSIPGMRVDLEPDEFEEIIARVGCAITAQSSRLVPADKTLYELRDRTATVPCIGLIASSIVSKKIAGGAQRIAFDVKMGGGAFMKTVPQARELAEMLVDVASEFGRQAVALITDMNQPLSPYIGNGVEVILAREFLAGRDRPARLESVVRAVASELLSTHLKPAEASAIVQAALEGDEPAKRFEAMIEAQGGDVKAFREMQPLPAQTAIAPVGGTIAAVDTQALGNFARRLVERYGHLAGVRVDISIGDRVDCGTALGSVFGGNPHEAQEFCNFFAISDEQVTPPPLVYERIGRGASSTLSMK